MKEDMAMGKKQSDKRDIQHGGMIMAVKIVDITIPKKRLRKFDKSKMLELAESMKDLDLLQPRLFFQ
jgi:hypothetical protein